MRVMRGSPASDDAVAAQLLGVDGHRAQLEDLEVLRTAAEPHLAEEHGAAVLELDGARRERQQRGGQREPGGSADDVDRALDALALAVHRVPSARSQTAGTPRTTSPSASSVASVTRR